jgi:hypothetical protein
LRASRALVRLGPQNPTSYGYLGEALLRTGDRVTAKEALLQALQIEPRYAFAGYQLIDTLIDETEYEKAQSWIDKLREQLGDEPPPLVYRAMRLLQAQRKRDAMIERLEKLADSDQSDEKLLQTAVELCRDVNWTQSAMRALRDALDSPTPHPIVGKLWLDCALACKAWSHPLQLEKLLDKGELGLKVLVNYASALGRAAELAYIRKQMAEVNQMQAELKKIATQFRANLHPPTWAWGQIGSAFGNAKLYDKAIEWMSDYAKRRDAQPWMLINHALHLRTKNRVAEAAEVNRFALDLDHPDYTSVFHQFWISFDEALAGNTASARQKLSELDDNEFDDYHDFLLRMLEGLLDVQEAAPAQKAQAFQAAKIRYEQALQAFSTLEQSDGLKETYQRWVNRLAKDAGGLMASLWAMWASWFPRLPREAETSA